MGVAEVEASPAQIQGRSQNGRVWKRTSTCSGFRSFAGYATASVSAPQDAWELIMGRYKNAGFRKEPAFQFFKKENRDPEGSRSVVRKNDLTYAFRRFFFRSFFVECSFPPHLPVSRLVVLPLGLLLEKERRRRRSSQDLGTDSFGKGRPGWVFGSLLPFPYDKVSSFCWSNKEYSRCLYNFQIVIFTLFCYIFLTCLLARVASTFAQKCLSFGRTSSGLSHKSLPFEARIFIRAEYGACSSAG